MVALLDEHGLPTKHVIYVNESMVDKVNELIMKGGRAVPVGHLIGYNTKFPPSPQGDIELSVLKREGVDLSMFMVKSIPRLSVRGGYRPLFTKPIIIDINPVNDELNIVFRLPPRGNYATVFLREFIKSRKPEVDFA
ncbi:tRNA pseudouridine(13) synthase TruD [Vulcanisaeta distributa]|uniref:tRNA pseudouridine(13) synthase TruD n=1 Tax=Vulcanisaeta distributa TaxID=164451 RepID=UPI000AAB80B8|nr:tRNA pseudouridine(13) synthase TruD [Vulcanisaeta distributa]